MLQTSDLLERTTIFLPKIMSEYLLNPSEPTPANKMKFDDYLPDTLKLSVIFRLPAELGKYIRICKSMAAPMRRWSQCGHSPTLRAPGTGSMSACLLADVWADQSYLDTTLPQSIPALALLHPTDPDKVYFFISSCILPWTCG